MRSVARRLLLTLFFIIGSISMDSCCTETYRITEGGKLIAYEDYRNPDNYIDTVRGPFSLTPQIDREFVAATKGLSFITATYATSCDNVFTSTLDTTSTILTADKSFVVAGDTISAGRNLETVSGVGVRTSGEGGGYREYDFTEEFLGTAQFDTGRYVFTFSGPTSDSIQLRFSKELQIRL